MTADAHAEARSPVRARRRSTRCSAPPARREHWSRRAARPRIGVVEPRTAGASRAAARDDGVTYNVSAAGARDAPWVLDPVPRAGGATSGRRSSAASSSGRAARPRPHRPLRAARAAPPAASSRPRSCSATRASCAPATASACPARTSSSTTPPTSARYERRQLVGARRPHPGAVGRRATRWRTGSSSRGCCPSLYRDARRAPARAVLPLRCASALQAAAPPGVEDPRIVVLTPGPVQRDRVRARLPGLATLGLPARRGLRPDRARRLGCGCGRSAGSSRSTSSCAGSTTATATRSSCGPTPSSACPASSRRPARHRVGGQRARHRRAREPRRCCRSCRAVAEHLLGQDAAPARGADAGGAATPPARAHVLAHLDRARACGRSSREPRQRRRVRLGARAAERDDLRAPHRGPAGRLGRPGGR